MDKYNTNLLILGIGVSVNENDGIKRFKKYCESFDLKYKIVGAGKVWKGGDMDKGPGGGQKINEIRLEIENMTDSENKLLLICDTFDVVPLGCQEEIVEKFNAICCNDFNKVIFSSEVYCWPDNELSDSYPESDSKYKFLNSGCIIGYRHTIYNLIKDDLILDYDDDQRYFTKKYLDNQNNQIILDNKCELFQCLNGSHNDITIFRNRCYNKYTDSYPVFIHGNGPSKIALNRFTNYIETDVKKNMSTRISSNNRCTKVFLALYINSSDNHNCLLFIDHVKKICYDFLTVYAYDCNSNIDIENTVRKNNWNYIPNIKQYIFDDFLKTESEWYLLIEQKCIITRSCIVTDLLNISEKYQCNVISPMLVKKYNNFSNFWGDIDGSGFYRRSDDYYKLISYVNRGIFNVPYVTGIILINMTTIKNISMNFEETIDKDIDMELAKIFRDNTVFMYMANYHNYGYLLQ